MKVPAMSDLDLQPLTPSPLKRRRQAGMTLIEVIVVLAIGALIIGGALSLYTSASASQSTNQFNAELAALRAATKSLYAGQGGYAVGSLNTVLINAKKVPTTMTVVSPVINHSMNGTVTVTGATTNFTITATAIPTEVCVGVVAAASGYTQIQVGSNAARTTFPVPTATASTDCAAAATQNIVFTSL
jgi:prepilin-type N-terminal cleavage/methylation domain-containing protein